MRRSATLAAAALLLAGPALAQGTVSFGQAVQGELSAAGPTLDDGSHYHLWRFQGTAGQRVVVMLRSEAFDAFLTVGADVGDGCEACETDDDGAGGTDARVRTTLPHTGTYEIRAGSYSAGQTGAYTLTLSEWAVARPRGEIRAGQTVTGELDASDAARDGNAVHELWTYRGRPGERIRITLRSDEIDAYLGWGRLVGERWEELDADDDGADEGGTDSRLDVVLGDDGVYHISAGAFLGGQHGAYTLTVERG